MWYAKLEALENVIVNVEPLWIVSLPSYILEKGIVMDVSKIKENLLGVPQKLIQKGTWKSGLVATSTVAKLLVSV